MLTPYQFASNSPIIGVDLDGLELATTTIRTVEQQGTFVKVMGDTEIKFKVLDLSTGSPNQSARTSSENRVGSFVQQKLSQQRRITNRNMVSGGSDDVEFNLKVDVDFEPISSLRDLKNNDALIVIVDDIDFSFNDKFGNTHGAGAVAFSAGVLIIPKRLYESATDRILEHEIGHLFSLDDLEDADERSNIMYHLNDAKRDNGTGRLFLSSQQGEDMIRNALGYKTRLESLEPGANLENQPTYPVDALEYSLDKVNASYDESLEY